MLDNNNYTCGTSQLCGALYIKIEERGGGIGNEFVYHICQASCIYKWLKNGYRKDMCHIEVLLYAQI